MGILGTYHKTDLFLMGEEVDRGGGVFEDEMVLEYVDYECRFTRRKHRIEREKQGNADEDIWDVLFEPEPMGGDGVDDDDLEKYFLRRSNGTWYECLNFRAQRDHAGSLHHYTAKVKQIPEPSVPINEDILSSSG